MGSIENEKIEFYILNDEINENSKDLHISRRKRYKYNKKRKSNEKNDEKYILQTDWINKYKFEFRKISITDLKESSSNNYLFNYQLYNHRLETSSLKLRTSSLPPQFKYNKDFRIKKKKKLSNEKLNKQRNLKLNNLNFKHDKKKFYKTLFNHSFDVNRKKLITSSLSESNIALVRPTSLYLSSKSLSIDNNDINNDVFSESSQKPFENRLKALTNLLIYLKYTLIDSKKTDSNYEKCLNSIEKIKLNNLKRPNYQMAEQIPFFYRQLSSVPSNVQQNMNRSETPLTSTDVFLNSNSNNNKSINATISSRSFLNSVVTDESLTQLQQAKDGQTSNNTDKHQIVSLIRSLSEPCVNSIDVYNFFDFFNLILNHEVVDNQEFLSNNINFYLRSYLNERVKFNFIQNDADNFEIDGIFDAAKCDKLNRLKNSMSFTSFNDKSKLQIKRSQSFDKFLKNIVKGKKKSLSLCINNQQEKTSSPPNMLNDRLISNNSGNHIVRDFSGIDLKNIIEKIELSSSLQNEMLKNENFKLKDDRIKSTPIDISSPLSSKSLHHKNSRKKASLSATRYATTYVGFHEDDIPENEFSSTDSLRHFESTLPGILPAKKISKFKPVVIRACTAPSTSLIMMSSSTDSFLDSNKDAFLKDLSLNAIDSLSSLDKLNMAMSSSVNSNSGADLLINECIKKKKPSVTRSFSYNISKFTPGFLTSSPPTDKMISRNSILSTIMHGKTGIQNTNSNVRLRSLQKYSKNKIINNTENGHLTTLPLAQIGTSVSTSDIPNTTDAITSFSVDNEAVMSKIDNNVKRKAIFLEMHETEKSYVEALKNLVTKYYMPLKEKEFVERNLVNDIFYKIPEIHVHHELLLSSLKAKLDAWDSRQTVGDLLLNIFAKQSVIETYISFVNNFHTSQEAYRICKDQSSLFGKFIQQQAKDHRGKLTLKDLIIQPVQRIPRYELFIKDFIKNTPETHPDHQLLLKAQKELHNLAEKIDQVHKEVNELYGNDSQSCLQIIQDLIENLDDLVTAYRYYIRHDMITIFSSNGVKKDRCIFLFSDLIIITNCKRRSGNLNKRTNSVILNSPIGKQYLETLKHKLLMKLQFEDVDIVCNSLTKKASVEKDHLEDDLNLITKINELAKNILYPHQLLDESIKDTMANITRQLNDTTNTNLSNGNGLNNLAMNNNTNNTATDAENKQIVLNLTGVDRIESMTLVFSSVDQRANWEKCFIDARKNFFESCSRKPAVFINNIPIPRNRSGIQFTCASARTNMLNEPNDIWVCSTDGQVGQICIMNTIPEFSVSSCNTVCSSRITCILCAPSYITKKDSKKMSDKKTTDNLKQHRITTKTIEKSPSFNQNIPSLNNNNNNNESVINTDSSDDEDLDDNQSGNEKQPDSDQTNNTNNPITNENKNSTMWIGTDDGWLHVFQFNDSSLRTIARKNRIQKQFSSNIVAIVYMDNKVFVSLSNCELVMFHRNFSGMWNFDDHITKSVSQYPVTAMLGVSGKLWCSSGNSVVVVNTNNLTVEHTFVIDGEKRLLLASGGSSSSAVWVASHQSLDIRLYHATKYIVLAEINIRQCLTQKFMYIDELIRLHKISCLKITCLYLCKDTLWIGTSAGIIVNVKVPHVNNTTTKLNTGLNYIALNHGHIGPVRFITSVEVLKRHLNPNPNISSPDTSTKNTNNQLKTFIIAGGEGYEEYKSVGLSGASPSINSAMNMSSNQSSTNLITEMTSITCNTPGSNTSTMSTTFSLPSQNTLARQNSSSMEENIIGKDDLTNYVLIWEV